MSLQELALLCLSFLLGATFILIQTALHYVDGTFLICARLILAGLFALVMNGPSILKLKKYDAYTGAIIGVTLFLAYMFQTSGLHYITSSQAAFITALYVPSVPFMQWCFTKEAPALGTWVSICCSFTGLVIFTGYENIFHFHWGLGEFLTLGGAFFIALAVVLTSQFSPHMDNAQNTTTIQLLAATLLAGGSLIYTRAEIPHFGWGWFLPIAALALISICHRFISNWAQKSVPPTRTALILASEPLWAGLIGWRMGETFSLHMLIGGLLIMTGVVASELCKKPQIESQP